MLAYWLLFLLPVIPALLSHGVHKKRDLVPWIFLGLVFTLAIGLRYQVGGDWFNYLLRYREVIYAPIEEIVARGDPGYYLFNWLSARLDWGVFGVNTLCAVVFVFGLFIFCRDQTAPWLAFTVAVPYLVVVMAMGYTRQSVALGLFFLALRAIEQGRFLHYLGFLVVAAMFHKTAVLLMPLGILIYGKGWIWRVVAIGLTGFWLWDLLLAEHQEKLYRNYVEIALESEGAQIRVMMNVVPGLLFLIYRKKWRAMFPAYWVWFWLAIASIASVGVVGFATTAVDRMALYLTPLQVAVFSRLPLLARHQISPEIMRFGLVLGYAAVLFVWLNYATHARFWVPYQNWLFQ